MHISPFFNEVARNHWLCSYFELHTHAYGIDPGAHGSWDPTVPCGCWREKRCMYVVRDEFTRERERETKVRERRRTLTRYHKLNIQSQVLNWCFAFRINFFLFECLKKHF